MLPRRVLISPLWAIRRNGWARCPAREGVGRKSRVDQGHRRADAFVLQLGVEAGHLVRGEHALVDDRPRRAGGDVELFAGGYLTDPADHVELALEGFLVPGEAFAGPDEQLGHMGTGLGSRCCRRGWCRPERPASRGRSGLRPRRSRRSTLPSSSRRAAFSRGRKHMATPYWPNGRQVQPGLFAEEERRGSGSGCRRRLRCWRRRLRHHGARGSRGQAVPG